jgi:hypothetical protein
VFWEEKFGDMRRLGESRKKGRLYFEVFSTEETFWVVRVSLGEEALFS